MKHLDKPTKEAYYAELVRRCEANLFPSYNDNIGQCAYRGGGERACAVGIVLSDKVAGSLEEGNTLSSIWRDIEEHVPEWMDYETTHDLQQSHDGQRPEGDDWDEEDKQAFLGRVRNMLGLPEA